MRPRRSSVAATEIGSLKTAAKRLGMTFAAYMAKRRAGLKWCTVCKIWKRIRQFTSDTYRFSGLSARCDVCNVRHKLKWRQVTGRR